MAIKDNARTMTRLMAQVSGGDEAELEKIDLNMDQFIKKAN
jgi:hypothetical protein